MKTTNNSAKKISQIAFMSLLLIGLASCGSYKYDDSIYASSKPKERIIYIERPSENNYNASEKKSNYFLDQAEQFKELNDKDVLVDIDSLSSDADDNISYVNGTPWEYTNHTTVNIYTQPNYYGGYSGYGYYNYYNPYFNTPYYGYYDYYNPYYSNYYYYPSAYIGFGFPFFGGYFSYNPYRGYYNPYYGNYYGGRSYANYSKRVTYNTHNIRQTNNSNGYNRNSNNFSNKNNFINNNSNKRNNTNTYNRNTNNNNNNYNRNNTNKNKPVYKNNSNNNNPSYNRNNNSGNSNYKRNGNNSGNST
ncbi:MAG: hypothetical protein GW912_04010, partial [Zetaproteobacteria bacterium]|nr:hypothetical protein [Flavobacteriales bacterium]